MRRARTLRLAFASIFLGVMTGCGGASMVLRSPAVSKCEDAGLRSCGDLVDGVLAYADGKPAEGQAPLKRGIGENMDDPDSIEKFVAALKLMKNVPTVGGYIASIEPALNVMQEAAKEAKKNPRPKREKPTASGSGSALAKGSDAKGGTSSGATKTRTVLVGSSSKAKPCAAFGGMSVANLPTGAAKCVQVISGPYSVTDVHLASGCPNAVFIAVGDPEAPRWFVASSPGQPLEIHGAQFVVDADESVWVGQIGASKDAAISGEIGCAVTWTGG